MKLTQKQIELVDAQVKRLIAGDSYYGKLYREKGITGVASQEDFEKLPFSSKDDLRNAYPLGIQAVPDEDVVPSSSEYVFIAVSPFNKCSRKNMLIFSLSLN